MIFGDYATYWWCCDVMLILLFNKIRYVVFIYIYMKNRDLLVKYIILRGGVIFINRDSSEGW